MKRFIAFALALIVAFSIVSPPRVSARTLCDDLADAIKASQTKIKRYKLLLKLFGDCNDLDADEKAILKRAIAELGSGKAKMEKYAGTSSAPHLAVGGVPAELASVTVATPTGAAPPVDKRLAFTGKRGFPFGFLVVNRLDSGAFDARVTIAVGDQGLQNTVTGGSLQLDRPPFDDMGQNGFATSLDVAWLQVAHGFLVTARDDAHPSLGSLKIVANTDEIDLRIEQTDTTFTLYVRPTPADRTSEDGWQTVYTNAQAVDATPFSFVMIARGLDQKATVFFDFFRLTGPNVGGAVERPLIDQIGATVVDPMGAADDAASDNPDLAGASASLQLGIDGIAASRAAIQAAIDAGTLQKSTDGKGAVTQLGKASKALAAAKKLADKGNAAMLAAIDKKIVGAARNVAVAVANLVGLNVKSFKKIGFGHPIF